MGHDSGLMDTDELEFRVLDSKRGAKIWISAGMAVVPGVVFAIMLTTDLVGGTVGVVWICAVYFIILFAVSSVIMKSQAGDRLVIKNRYLYIYRGEKLRRMISVKQVTSIKRADPRIFVLHDSQATEFSQKNYAPKTWEQLAVALEDFVGNKSAIAVEIKAHAEDKAERGN